MSRQRKLDYHGSDEFMDESERGKPSTSKQNQDVDYYNEEEYDVLGADELKLTKDKDLSKLDLHDITFASIVYWHGKGAEKLDNYDDEQGNYLAVEDDHIQFRYRIRHAIHKGKFSTLLKAYDCKDKKEVAIKIFAKNSEASASRESDFFHHLKLFDPVNIECNNIVQAMGFFDFRKHPCIVFELLQNDLTTVIDQNPNGLGKDVMKQIVKSILLGLQYLHSNGVIHANLEPSNIVLTGDNYNCKIIDLGHAVYTKTVAERFLLPPDHAYRPPELFFHAPYTFSVDVFALGLIVGELATGKRLFAADNVRMQMVNYIEVLGLPPREYIDDCPNAPQFFRVIRDRTIQLLPLGVADCLPASKTLEDFLNIKNDPLLIDFIKKCLHMYQAERFSVDNLLQHIWLQ